MALIVNSSQFLRKGVTYPRGVYSRVVSIAGGLEFIADEMNACSPVLADRFWLLGIDVWLSKRGDPQTETWWFRLKRGFQYSHSNLVIAQWEDLLPLYAGDERWSWHGESLPFHMHWNVNQYFEGGGQRLAVLYNITTLAVCYIHVSFQISEG